MKSKAYKPKKQKQKISIDQGWDTVNAHAAGVDIGAREHLACVPPGSTPNNVRAFGTLPPTSKPWPIGSTNAA